MENRFKKMELNYFQRIFFSFVAILLFLVIVLVGFLTTYYKKNTLRVIHDLNSRLLSQSTFSASYVDEISVRFSNSLNIDNTIINYLYSKKKDNMAAIKASSMINKLMISHPYIDSVYLYNAFTNEVLSTVDGGQYKKDEFIDSEIIDLIHDKEFVKTYKGKPIPRNAKKPLGNTQVYSYLRFEKNDLTRVQSTIVINIKASSLTDALTSLYPKASDLKTQFIITDNHCNIVGYTVSDELIENKETDTLLKQIVMGNSKDNNFNYDLNNEKYIVSYSNTNNNDWYFISLTPFSSIFSDLTKTTAASLAITIFVLIFTTLLCLYLAKRLYNPLKKMLQNVKSKLGKGTFQAVQNKNSNEINFLENVFETMNSQAEEFMKFKDETMFAVKNDFLKGLFTGNAIYSVSKTNEIIREMKLDYILSGMLCMCLLKIDNYDVFRADNNNKERWALRYAIVNIATELSGESFSCEVCNMDTDKIVILIDANKFESYAELSRLLEASLKKIQAAVDTFLQITLTAAYSPLFKSYEQLGAAYRNLVELSLNKLKYGHGSIISPLTLENDEFVDFNFPTKHEEILVEYIKSSKLEEAKEVYLEIIELISPYSYGEIMSYIFHLSYYIYSSVQSSHKDLTQDFTGIYKEFLSSIETCEVLTGINEEFLSFIQQNYQLVASHEVSSSNSFEATVITVKEIVGELFYDKGLCLNSIADRLSHSSAYLGRIFREMEGKSVSKYINEVRMEKIAEYLKNTDLSIDDILDLVGLERTNYFYTSFKKHFGVSLRDYKQGKII